MVLLTDDQQNPMSQPTKANILRAMHWLVKDAQPNDSLFFHYSGTSITGCWERMISNEVQATVVKLLIWMVTKTTAMTKSSTRLISVWQDIL